MGDSTGRIHRINTAGGYTVTRDWVTPTLVPELYEGYLPVMYVGNFHPQAGNELMVLNTQLDWVLLDSNGIKLYRLFRQARKATGPGISAVANIDLDSEEELLVPSLDGHVWRVDWVDPPGELQVTEFTPQFLNRAITFIAPANLDGTSNPSHYLLFGVNDSEPPFQSSRIMLLRVSDKQVIDVVTQVDIRHPSFAWISPPPLQVGSAEFVVGCHGIEKWSITSSTSMSLQASMPPDYTVELEDQTITGGVVALTYLANPSVLFATYSNGKIMALDTSLQHLRLSSKEWGVLPPVPNAIGLPWPSNRTFSRTPTFDLYQVGQTKKDLYFADFSAPFYKENTRTAYRVGRVDFLSTPPTYVPYVQDAIPHQPFARVFEMEVADYVSDGIPEIYYFAQTGVNLPTLPLRSFENLQLDASVLPGSWEGFGGCIAQYLSPGPPLDYSLLSGFTVPRPSPNPHFDNGAASGNWWYPRVGSNVLTGQIACYSQGAYEPYDGTSMSRARFFCPGCGMLEWHVVTGTIGGYVYAVEPGPSPQPGVNFIPSELNYSSDPLGGFVTGMDTGDVDPNLGNGDEVVVGVEIDTGTYSDWLANDKTKNRGHVYILRANAATSKLDKIFDLTGDDLTGVGLGTSLGVSAVKIDDVNNDGQPEIWANDAAGYVYLFRRNILANTWSCRYRSKALGLYPGMWNNLHPVKDSFGKTTVLVVVSPGYVMAFNVDPNKVTQP